MKKPDYIIVATNEWNFYCKKCGTEFVSNYDEMDEAIKEHSADHEAQAQLF
jgi:hypothetical protein